MTNSVKTIEINSGIELILEDGVVTVDVIVDNNKIVGSAIGGAFQPQNLATEADFSEEMNHLGETTGRVSSTELVDKKDIFRGNVETVSYVEVLHI